MLGTISLGRLSFNAALLHFPESNEADCERQSLLGTSTQSLSHRNYSDVGGSPGLVVMGGDSCSKGREFDSRHSILDGHFFTFMSCKNCGVCLKRRK